MLKIASIQELGTYSHLQIITNALPHYALFSLRLGLRRPSKILADAEEELVERFEDFTTDSRHEGVMSEVHHLPDGREVAVEELVADMDTGFGSRRRHGIQRAKLQGLPLGQHSYALYTDERTPRTIKAELPGYHMRTSSPITSDISSRSGRFYDRCSKNGLTIRSNAQTERTNVPRRKKNGSLFRDEIDLVEQLPQQAVPMKLWIFRVSMIEMSGGHGRSTEFLENG
jgi:hypothetical protein